MPVKKEKLRETSAPTGWRLQPRLGRPGRLELWRLQRLWRLRCLQEFLGWTPKLPHLRRLWRLGRL